MKRLMFILTLVSSLAIAAGEVPRKAIDFAVQTAPSKYIWLHEYAGKTVILAFILTDCPHCQFTTGILNKIQKEYASRSVQVIESAIEPMSSLHIPAFVQKMGTTFPVGYDEQAYASKFLGRAEEEPMLMPQVVFIDRKGAVQAQFSGDDPGFANAVQETTLRNTLDRVLKQGQATARPPVRRK